MKAVCHADDVPLGEGRRVTLDGAPVAIFRTATGWFATAAVCPHRGGPLADGIVSDCQVTCPLHERRYALDTGAPIEHDGPGVEAFAVELRDGVVYLGEPVAAAAA